MFLIGVFLKVHSLCTANHTWLVFSRYTEIISQTRYFPNLYNYHPNTAKITDIACHCLHSTNHQQQAAHVIADLLPTDQSRHIGANEVLHCLSICPMPMVYLKFECCT